MTNALRNIKTEYLVLAPMIPMVVHIYSFFNAYDHWMIAAGVAATFDITLFMLFKYLRTREIRRDPTAYRTLWVAITIMAGFQLYANIRVYWAVDPGPDAVVMGSIMPVIFVLLVYLFVRIDPNKILTDDYTFETDRDLCERIFKQYVSKSEAVKAAIETGIPKSSAYRYWNEFEQKGHLN